MVGWCLFPRLISPHHHTQRPQKIQNLQPITILSLSSQSTMKLLLSLALASTSVRFAAAASNGHKCACEAIEMDFEINCENDQAMLDALDYLG